MNVWRSHHWVTIASCHFSRNCELRLFSPILPPLRATNFHAAKRNRGIMGIYLLRAGRVNKRPQPATQHCCAANSFSNSLIIHAVKIKEITTSKEAWKCDFNYKLWWIFPLNNFIKNYQWCEKLFKKFERVFHPFSQHLDFACFCCCCCWCLEFGWNTVARLCCIT